MRRTCLVLLATLALASSAFAAQGVNLRWDACLADGGVSNRNFACDTNAGSEQLYVSFELDSTQASVSGLQCYLLYTTPSGTPGSWWQFKNTGSCRRDVLSLASSNPTPGSACVDWGMGTALGTFVSVWVDYLGTGQNRLSMISSVPSSAPLTLTPGHEYFAFRVSISHAKTAGTGACGGCSVPVCLGIEALRLEQSGGGHFDLATETRYGSSVASWQGSAPSSYFVHYSGSMNPDQDRDYRVLECAAAVPARNPTWGTIKSLYR